MPPRLWPTLLRRLLGLACTLLAASVVVFAALDLLPGDAAQVILGTGATPEAVAELRARLGLDQAAWQRYAGWVGGLLQGDTAVSLSYGEPTALLIGQRLAVTLPLAALAMALTLLGALGLGVTAARHTGRWPGRLADALAQLGLAVPGFWVAIVLVLVFAVQLGWVGAGGFPGWSADDGGGWWPAWRALALPALALALVQAAILGRVTRGALLEVAGEDWARTARAKGLSEGAVWWRHALPNALIPVTTVAGLQFANLLVGTIVVEQVFVLPGLGRLVVQAIANRDLPVVRDVVLLLAAAVLVVNAAVDALQLRLDPRLRRT